MSASPAYFKSRRRRLRRLHLCTRCGSAPAANKKTICFECAAVKVIKASHGDNRARHDAKRKTLLDRLDLINAARVAVMTELDAIPT